RPRGAGCLPRRGRGGGDRHLPPQGPRGSQPPAPPGARRPQRARRAPRRLPGAAMRFRPIAGYASIAACATTAAAALLLAACGGGAGGGAPDDGPPDDLGAWGLFADAPAQIPAADVIPYEVIAPLYSDYTAKRRFFRLPPGGRIGWRERGPWRFPVGTVVVKTFSMPRDLRDPAAGERLLETRLLVREADGWVPHVYVWDDARTAARRRVAGARLPVEWIHHDGTRRTSTWRVPNTNQCRECHGRARTEVLGLHTAQLARLHDYGAGPVDPIDHFRDLGLFEEAPPAG